MRNIFRTFIDSLFGREKAAGGANKTPSANLPIGGGIIDLTPKGDAMNIATVFGCVDVLSANVSNLPMVYRAKHDGIFVPDEHSRLNYLLNVQPNDSMSATTFWRLAVQYMLLKGNVYIIPHVDKDGMAIDALYLLDPDYVSHNTNDDTYTVTGSTDGLDGKYYEHEMIHVLNVTTDGKTGVSTLTYAKICTETALVSDNENLNRFKNGGNVRGIVSNDTDSVRGFGDYQDEELAKTAASIDERFRAGERIVSVPGQAKFSQISLSSQDMQFLESRKFNGMDICRFFSVPPEFLYYGTSSNYKSVGMQYSAFLNWTLNPILKKFETEFKRKLIPMELSMKRDFKFDRKAIYSCDVESMATYQQKTIETGLYTVNEWRREMNKPEVEGGDKVLVSANLKGIDETNVPEGKKNNTEGEQND